MKNTFVRMAVILTLMLALGFFLGIAASGTAYASTTKSASGKADTAIAVSNTNTVDCNGRSDLFQIYDGTGSEFCYANAGDYSPNISFTVKFCSGNNAGYIITDPTLGADGKLYFDKNQCIPLPLPKITDLHID